MPVFEPIPFGLPPEADAAAFRRARSGAFIQRWVIITRIPGRVKEFQKKLQMPRNTGQPNPLPALRDYGASAFCSPPHPFL
jgi:hypothetical protein